MSLALVRQALAFVDQEETVSKRGKRASPNVRPGAPGQDHRHLYKKKAKKNIKQITPKEQIAEENIKKLLALSKPAANTTIAGKILQRAIKGKPLLEKIEVKQEEEKSILFPEENTVQKSKSKKKSKEEESFKEFERTYFCK